MFKQPDKHWPRETGRSHIPSSVLTVGVFATMGLLYWGMNTLGELMLSAVVLAVVIPAAIIHNARTKGK